MALKQIWGQNQALEILRKSAENNALAHAYLFYGPPSVGKKRTATEFAKALNCLEQGPQEACDQCSSCKKIAQGIHPDFFLITPTKSSPSAKEGYIRIEETRDLQKKLMYLPYEGKFKVAILDEVEKMNRQAANSFLKTLEEPPKSTLIILITSNPYQLLATIASRCQGVKFNPLPAKIIQEILSQQMAIDPPEAELRSLRSQGQLDIALKEDLLNSSQNREELIDLIESVSFKRMDLVFQWPKTWSKKTDQINDLLDELMNLLRDLAFLKVRCPNEYLVNSDLFASLNPLAIKKKLSSLIKMFQIVQDTKLNLQANQNTQLSLEMMLIGFCDQAV